MRYSNDDVIKALNKATLLNEVYFFKNKLPQELSSLPISTKLQYKLGIFYENNVPDPYTINSVHDLLPKSQPTESIVRNALIWSYGITGEKPDYLIKAGGGSRSDNQFQSQLFQEIADPFTGLDKRVCLIWIGSTDFKNVIITDELVRNLAAIFISGKKKQLFNKDNIQSLISILLRAYSGFKINVSGKQTKLTPNIESLIYKHLSEYDLHSVESVISEFINSRRYELEQIKTMAKNNNGTHLSIEFHSDKSIEDLRNSTLVTISEYNNKLFLLNKIQNALPHRNIYSKQLSLF